MAALALALGSSVLWGIADYLGGFKSRTYPVPVVLALMYLSSLIAMTIFVVARGEGPPGTQSVVAALCAGLVGIAALSAFYRALAIGTMSIVAPIASTGVALPVLVGVAGGEHPGLLRSIGIAAAVIGVVLASRESPTDDAEAVLDPRRQRQSIYLALVAGVGFGSYFVGAEIASRGDVGWSLLLSRISAAPIVIVIAFMVVRRGGRFPTAGGLLALLGIGLIDLAANAAYNHATTLGDLSVVSVASSLYPLTTVILAAVLLGERIRGLQRGGVALALAGVVAIAAGG